MEYDELTPSLKDRAKRLFFLGDGEGKGFIVRRDMQRMGSEVPLPPEQLEAVFDSLDGEGNGFLTLKQFLQGFGTFLSSRGPTSRTQTLSTSSDLDDQCVNLIEKISSRPVLQTGPLRQLCDVIRREGSAQMQTDLESVLKHLEEDMRRMDMEHNALQEATKARDEDHDERIRKLFEEMESNIIEEKLKITAQFESRASQLKREMEEELTHRDQSLQQALAQRSERDTRLQQALASVAEEQRASALLQQEKEELIACCAQQSLELKQLREQKGVIRTLSVVSNGENQNQLATGFKIAQAMFRQEQGLLEQLKLLRTVAETLEKAKQQKLETKVET